MTIKEEKEDVETRMRRKREGRKEEEKTKIFINFKNCENGGIE